jgi:hypothetical protein
MDRPERMHIMLRTSLEMPMRSRLNKHVNERCYNDYKQAAGLLRHDLVWSDDFEAIRIPLADLIDFHADYAYHPSALTDIVRNLIAEENDLSI